MLHWVHDHFKYDPSTVLFEYNGLKYTFKNLTVADLYTLNHVFSDGKYHGVCDEYATLYVSFMRALNVPARYMIISLHEVDGNFTAHAFAEVWVNDPSGSEYFWMHADPTWNIYNNPSAYKDDPRYDEVIAAAVWQEADDTHSNWDIFEGDLLLAGWVRIADAMPSRKNCDFKIGFAYSGPNDYT